MTCIFWPAIDCGKELGAFGPVGRLKAIPVGDAESSGHVHITLADILRELAGDSLDMIVENLLKGSNMSAQGFFVHET
jgi:hypothetical protein